VGRSGVSVIAPEGVSVDEISGLLKGKAQWILDQQKTFKGLSAYYPPPRQFVSGEGYRYLGRQYRLLKFPKTQGQGVKLRGRYLEAYADTSEEARAALEVWYRQRALTHLPERLEMYSLRLGRVTPPVTLSNARNKWGSCNKNGEVRFNWRIIMAPMSLVDYVVAHELCHLVELNHSKAFWQLLGKLLPNYAEHREKLDLESGLYRL